MEILLTDWNCRRSSGKGSWSLASCTLLCSSCRACLGQLRIQEQSRPLWPDVLSPHGNIASRSTGGVLSLLLAHLNEPSHLACSDLVASKPATHLLLQISEVWHIVSLMMLVSSCSHSRGV